MKIKKLLPWFIAIGFALLFLGTLLIKDKLRSSSQQQKPATLLKTTPALEQQEVQEAATATGNIVDEGVLVTRVIDGDTIELEDGTRVRYIGIDTPEPDQCFGSEATQTNIGLVENQKVKLETDIQKQDKYGRTLAYIWAGTTLVNEKLVRDGFAKVTTYPPDVKYVDMFLEAQKEAREEGRGLWAKDVCSKQEAVPSSQVQSSQTECIIKGNISSSGEKIYHMPGQRYYERTKIEENKGERWFCSEEDAVSAGWRKSKV